MRKKICAILTAFLFTSCSNNVLNKDANNNRSDVEKITLEKTIEDKSEETIEFKKIIDINVDENDILEYMKAITKEPREMGSRGEYLSMKFIRSKLMSWGYNVEIQGFDVYKQIKGIVSDITEENLQPLGSKVIGTGLNIIAKRENHDENKKTLFLVAHYDTTEGTLGVMDNATGVGVVLEAAKQLAQFDSPFNIEILIPSAEEYVMTGSRTFMSKLSEEERESILGCINVDMVGQKNAGPVIMGSYSGEENIISRMLNDHRENKLDFTRLIGSDHFSFFKANIPDIMLTNKILTYKGDEQSNPYDYLLEGELKNTVEIITDFILKFDMNEYEDLLNEINRKAETP